MPDLMFDPALKSQLPQYRFAWAWYHEVSVQASSPAFVHMMDQEQRRIKTAYLRDQIIGIPGVRLSRSAFRSLGLDPARYRPAQEALYRRVVNGKPVRYMNSGVDTNNFLSLRYQAPMGLYAAVALTAPVVLKVGEPGEEYAALNGRAIQCASKLIARDRKGPFGSPFVDSVRTAVLAGQTELLHIIYFLPDQIQDKELKGMVRVFQEFLGGHTDGYKTEAT